MEDAIEQEQQRVAHAVQSGVIRVAGVRHDFRCTVDPSNDLHSIIRIKPHSSTADMFETFYQTVMRRSSLYVGFILVGSYFGEKALHGTFDSAWEQRNQGKLFHQLTLPEGEDDE